MLADLHIHSHYSLATSKKLVPEYLDWWSARKGIELTGSGDILHSGWLAELKMKLEPAGKGLYKLKKKYRFSDGLPAKSKSTNFILSGEISSIYKDKGKTRKIHQLFLVPGLETAELFQKALLKRKVNITSDGRPICGLSARNLLETALETDERIYCIPAHIWTPWFSLLGAKSGYDSVEECYEDLSGYIKTLETGLSADAEMIRLVSNLDDYHLISCSDAHSPLKLGRNSTVLEAGFNWDEIIYALQNGKLKTLDTYPQLGKYYLDGHRKCNICMQPEESARNNGICPVCGKPLTQGVLSRVFKLADREKIPAGLEVKSQHFLPLPQILSLAMGKGENSKTVQKEYNRLLQEDAEFFLLLNKDREVLKSKTDGKVAELITNIQSGKIDIKAGYDGVFGTVVGSWSKN